AWIRRVTEALGRLSVSAALVKVPASTTRTKALMAATRSMTATSRQERARMIRPRSTRVRESPFEGPAARGAFFLKLECGLGADRLYASGRFPRVRQPLA